MATTKKTDLADELGLVLSSDGIPTKTWKFLGQTWHIVCDVNAYSLAAFSGGDFSGLRSFVIGMLIEDEQDRFSALLGKVRNLDGEALGRILNEMVEVASERPTEQPSSSSPSGKSRASVRKSTAASS